MIGHLAEGNKHSLRRVRRVLLPHSSVAVGDTPGATLGRVPGTISSAMAAKRVSVRLEDFPAEELEHLVLWYPFIRRELERRPRITIPRVTSASEALRVLYELEARGDLWIRISTSGNLNVDVRMREYELDDAGHVYSPVVKVPSLERLAQRLREHPGEDPLLARGAWRFSIAPETLEPPSRWQAEAESREYATFIEPPGDIARVRLSTVASLLVRELPQLDESKAARIALLIDQKLKALV